MATREVKGKRGARRAKTWWVYVLATVAPRPATYVGSTNDLARRLRQHNGLAPGGAARTRAGRPWSVARTLGPFAGRAHAQVVEARVKKLRGARRLERDVVITVVALRRRAKPAR